MPTVTTNGVETYYEQRGAGPPVVFVHGAVLDHSQWTPQVAALCDEYATVAYDVRGHGRTGGSARATYSIELFADDLAALVDALGLDRHVVCGLSMGGCVAQAYAARYPDRVAGVALAGTFTPEMTAVGERLQLAVLRAAVPLVTLVGYERVQRLMVWAHERFNPGASGDYATVAALQAEMPPIETREFAKVMRALVAFADADLDLPTISAPALVLYGENEPSFIRRQARVLAAALPDACVREIPGAGHASNLDNPAFFTAALREFLDRHAAR